MPHIKVKPIANSTLEMIDRQSTSVVFKTKPFNKNDYLLGVEHKGEEFLLQLKREKELDMIKYDKVTRPLKVNLIKEAMSSLIGELDLKVEFSNIAQSNNHLIADSKYFKKIKDFESIVFPFDKIVVEVGFGSGRHLLFQAKNNPDRLYIGIEIHTPSAQQVLKQIELQGLDNIWVVNYDARLFLEMLPSNSCEQIFVHFPVPWDKKPHRRVISTNFTDEALRVLDEGGSLELRTDSENYFWYSLETFFASPKAEVNIVKNRDLAVTSKYEARWKRQDKNIYEVHLSSKERSPQKSLESNFSFAGTSYVDGVESRLPTKAVIERDFFVHFERVYEMNDGLLIKCAFGSFDRPEHKYIVIDSHRCRYYASPPVKTAVNFQAHQKIMEYLHA